MPINPITNVTHFPIEQTAHSSEEQRKRDQKPGADAENEDSEYKKQRTQAHDVITVPASNEEAALSSQYVDTPRVIDLLSHRPTAKPTEKNPFSHIKKLTAISDDKNRKKINKSL